MLNEQHGDLKGIPNLADVLHQLRCFRGIHACRRLIQQQAGVGCQGPQNLQSALGAVGQGTRPLVGVALHAEDAQQLLRPLPGDMLLPCETGEVQYAPCQAIPHGIVHSHHQVFRHGQVAEQTDILKGPGDAGLIHLGCGHAVGVLAVQHNGARCGLVHLCQQVEYGGFSRPVGADESGDLRAADGQVEILRRLQTAEGHAQPPIPGLKENPNCIDSTGALSLEKLPQTMVVIGGGVIGLELACAYAAFGTKITVVEAMDHMLPMLDGDLTKIGVAHMKKMGMDFHLECPVQSVESSPVGAKVVCKDKSGKTVTFEAEKVLVAIGRKANTAGLDLAAGKIDNDKGRILVNDKMETNVPGVYAIGDCVFGHAQLAHTASAMGEVASENICGLEAHYCEKTNPTCVYMEPEAASVGLTEEQCKAQGIAYKVGKFSMSANGKALILNGGEGLVKIIAGAEYGEILGMHIIGPRATDLIAEGALAIEGEMTLDEIIDTIHSHPTVTETMREAALNAEKRAIHTKN